MSFRYASVNTCTTNTYSLKFKLSFIIARKPGRRRGNSGWNDDSCTQQAERHLTIQISFFKLRKLAEQTFQLLFLCLLKPQRKQYLLCYKTESRQYFILLLSITWSWVTFFSYYILQIFLHKYCKQNTERASKHLGSIGDGRQLALLRDLKWDDQISNL